MSAMRQAAGKAAIEAAKARDQRWWTDAHEEDRAECIRKCASQIWEDQTASRQEMLRAARLYGSIPLLGLAPKLYRRQAISTRRSKLALNVIKSVNDTYVAMITDEQPRVTFQTTGADWTLQQRAQRLEQFNDGILFDTDFYDLATQLHLDVGLFGVAFLKPHIEWNGWDEPRNDNDEKDREQPRIVYERTHAWRLLRDDREWYSGKGRTQYELNYVDMLGLMEEFPDRAADIAVARGAKDFDEWGDASVSFADVEAEDVCVIEAWHTARTKQSGDGYHVIMVGDTILFEESWNETEMPHEALYRLRPAFGGIWGESLAAELEGIQFEINVLLQKIQRAHHLLAAGHWLVENGSDIATGTIDNQIGSIIRYRGIPPELKVVESVAPDVYAQLDRLYNRAFEIVGVAQMEAQGQAPPQLKSGEALLRYSQIVSKRFQPPSRLYQHFVVRLARRNIALARQIAEVYPDYALKATGPKMMADVKWADVELEEYQFLIKPYATNELAEEPSGKLEILQGLANSGYVPSKADVARMFAGHLDLESYTSFIDATYDWTMMVIESIVNKGEYIEPEPFLTKSQMIDAISRFQGAYFQAIGKKVPEERLRMLGDWMVAATEMVNSGALKLPEPPPPPPPPGMAAPPPGGGTPMPTIPAPAPPMAA
jgi:hypothetical protein